MFNYKTIIPGYLFPEEEMFQRLSAERKDVLDLLKPIANEIINAFFAANDSYQELAKTHPIARRQNNFDVTVIRALIIENLYKIKDVNIKPMNNSPHNKYIVIGNYTFWLKKLDKNGKPQINETKTSIKRIFQKTEGGDTMPVLILGFTTDSIQRVSSITVSYMNGEDCLWAPIYLNEIAMSINNQVSLKEEKPIEVNVKIKANKKQKIRKNIG